MLEISVYSHNFDTHREGYVKIKKSLNFLYQDYANNDKIISLLEYWLFSLSTLHRCYGNEGLIEFLLSRHNDPISYSYFNEFDIQERPTNKLKTYNKLILWIDRYFPIQYRLASAPSVGFFSRLLVKHTKLLVSQLPCNHDNTLVIKITEIINSYLLHFGINVNKELISKNIPDVFISKQIKCNNLREINLDCAPIEMMQFKYFECIFLLNRKINVVGHQHGGGYDVAFNDPLTYFEKKVANNFIGWGFSEENAHQTMYSTSQKIDNKNKNGNVIWIESSSDSKFTSFCYPVLFEVKKDSEITKYIHNELIEHEVNYLNKKYPGKLESNRYKDIRGTVIPSDQTAEKLLSKGDVVIFDNCMHSLMYSCLENEVLFLIVDKRDAVQYYTPKMLSWYKILRKNNLLFHDDEYGLLGKRIKALDFPRALPKEVYSYYKNLFNPTTVNG